MTLSRRAVASVPLPPLITVCNSSKLFDIRGQKFGTGQRVKTNVSTKGAERPDLAKVERATQTGGRETLRTYLGTIPDYATEVKGVKSRRLRIVWR